MQLKDKLIDLRKQKGLTQVTLAKEINYSDKVISKWENGSSTPDIEALSTLAKFYGVTLDELTKDCEIVKGNPKSKFPVLPKIFLHIILLFIPILIISDIFCMGISLTSLHTIIPLILVLGLIMTCIIDLVFVYLNLSRKINVIIIFSIISLLFVLCLINFMVYGGTTILTKPFITMCFYTIISTAFGFVTNRKC